MVKTAVKIFVNGQCLHGNRLIELTYRSLNASFLEGLMNEHELNTFGHVWNLAGITKNKSASFLIRHGNKATFCIFPLFKILNYSISKNIQANSCRGGALQLRLYGGVWPEDRRIDPSSD